MSIKGAITQVQIEVSGLVSSSVQPYGGIRACLRESLMLGVVGDAMWFCHFFPFCVLGIHFVSLALCERFRILSQWKRAVFPYRSLVTGVN